MRFCQVTYGVIIFLSSEPIPGYCFLTNILLKYEDYLIY